MAATGDRIERVAREAFGFEALRPGQREAIEAVPAGRDALAVMSTGSGKSAIAELAEDALEFLFLAPEQLANQDVLVELSVAQPSLLVIDEAHCISEWGHDFRPDYRRLGAAAEALGRPTILALTATAAPPVRNEIVARLALREPAVIIRGFDRPNIRLAVERFHGEDGEERKLRALADHVVAAPPPGIVYVATRRQAEELAGALCSQEVRAAGYHAGMRGAERDAVQERFMDGELDAVCATTAFGMGIDKAAPEGGEMPFAVGGRVAHAQWGEGVVQRYDDDAVVVLFDEVGYKTLALDVVREAGAAGAGLGISAAGRDAWALSCTHSHARSRPRR